jgi:hypothetical protein
MPCDVQERHSRQLSEGRHAAMNQLFDCRSVRTAAFVLRLGPPLQAVETSKQTDQALVGHCLCNPEAGHPRWPVCNPAYGTMHLSAVVLMRWNICWTRVLDDRGGLTRNQPATTLHRLKDAGVLQTPQNNSGLSLQGLHAFC